MTRFVQLHLLTNYPPSNLNRDDTGRPKSAVVGGVHRLRISSQSLKRAWRTSDLFQTALAGHLGTRTKRIGTEVHAALVAGGVADKTARVWARAVAQTFGKLKAEKVSDKNQDLETEQLVHLSPEERQATAELAATLVQRKSEPTPDELKLLRAATGAVDIAMFGRMLADAAEHNVEAAVQVAHAITVHEAMVDDDYFSAVDDLNAQGETGAGHIGERGFGAGLFYLYLAIDRESLKENLGGDEDLTQRALKALVQAITQISPSGMQASFASRAYAGFVLAEKGNQQPRSLAQAFLKPVRDHGGQGVFNLAVDALEQRVLNFDKVYGDCADARQTLNVEAGTGSLSTLAAFVAS
jgi:CRISPR system Cascade subunit CasC